MISFTNSQSLHHRQKHNIYKSVPMTAGFQCISIVCRKEKSTLHIQAFTLQRLYTMILIYAGSEGNKQIESSDHILLIPL